MDALVPEIDLRWQVVRFTLGDGSMRASLSLLNEVVEELGDESIALTMDTNEADEGEESDSDVTLVKDVGEGDK